MKKFFIYLLITLILSSCSSACSLPMRAFFWLDKTTKKITHSKVIVDGDGIVNNPYHTFTLAGCRAIYLFEHEEDKPNIRLVKSYLFRGAGTNNAGYFARNDYIIATFDVGAWDKLGLEFYYFKKKKKIKFIKSIGETDFLKYKNGLLMETTNLWSDTIIDTSLGYFTPGEIRRKGIYADFILDSMKFSEEDRREQNKILNKIKNDDINDYYRMTDSSKYHIYNYLEYFDFKKKKITKQYKQDVIYWSAISGDYMYILHYLAYTKLNLLTGKREKLFESIHSPYEIYSGREKYINFYPLGINLLLDSTIYCITSPIVKLNKNRKKYYKYEKNAIYKLEKEKFLKVTNLPYDKPRYAVNPNNEDIYVFMHNDIKKVCKYNIKTDKWTEYDFDTKDYKIYAVGFTDKYFVVELEDSFKEKQGVLLVNFDFSQIGEMFELNYQHYVMPSSSIISNQYQSASSSYRIIYPYIDKNGKNSWE